MAQSIKYYQDSITNSYVINAAAIGVIIDPTKWSTVNLDRCFIYAIAVIAWTIDNLFDRFKADVNEIISSQKLHSLRWYAGKAKEFQHGYNLVDEADYYNNAGIDPSLIEASKIIDYVAVVEDIRGLRIKVATDNGHDLIPLAPAQLEAFKFYMKEVTDAGVKRSVTTAVADSLKLSLRIIFNPLVLNSVGQRIDGTSSTPIPDAINLYLKNLPFNGVLSLQKLIDVIQAIEGVEDLNLDSAAAKYGALSFANINISYLPDAGYLRIASGDLTLTYIAA